MLPTSHPALMIVPIVDEIAEMHVLAQTHNVLRNDEQVFQGVRDGSSGSSARSNATLADAFSEFIATSSRLEASYRDLQCEVSRLSLELADRNGALIASLAENEKMRLALQLIVDSMPCGVIVLDRNGNISLINPETSRLLVPNSPRNSETCSAIVPEIRTLTGVNIDAVFAGKPGKDMEREICLQTAEGERWLEVRNRCLFESSTESTPNQTILILRDITARKRAEQDRDSGRNALALAEIATILAHEIRNPLASLELFAELIEQDGERRADWIHSLRAGIRSLGGTVNNVLTFHSLGALELAPLQLGALVVQAIQFIEPLASQAQVTIGWVDESAGLLVNGNEVALRQVMLNLLSNAIRYTPVGGHVAVQLHLQNNESGTLSYGEQRKQAVLTCEDSGYGINSDQIEHIFEPGFSGTGDTCGLGLAVCERIMKQHHGRISVSNQAMSGARFQLEVPALAMETVSA